MYKTVALYFCCCCFGIYSCFNKNVIYVNTESSVQFSRSVMSDSSWPHEPQHSRPPCPSPTPEVHPNSCPLSRRCHPTISSSVALLLLPSIFPSIRVFSDESAPHIRWSKYCSFSFSNSPPSEYSGLISFRIDGLDLLAVQRTLKSLLHPHSSKASILWCSAFFILRASLVAQRLKRLPAMRETWVQSLGRGYPLEKEMATHSSILAWRIPRT